MITGKMFPYILEMLVKKPATIGYPFERVSMPEGYRGKLKFSVERCIGCKICVKECPAKAIEIEKTSETEKKFQAYVSLDRCIYCGQCVDSCPKEALECTSDFELAGTQRDKLRVGI